MVLAPQMRSIQVHSAFRYSLTDSGTRIFWADLDRGNGHRSGTYDIGIRFR